MPDRSQRCYSGSKRRWRSSTRAIEDINILPESLGNAKQQASRRSPGTDIYHQRRRTLIAIILHLFFFYPVFDFAHLLSQFCIVDNFLVVLITESLMFFDQL